MLNAANEVAVAGFLEEGIRFIDIPRINRACLDGLGNRAVDDLLAEDVFHGIGDRGIAFAMP